MFRLFAGHRDPGDADAPLEPAAHGHHDGRLHAHGGAHHDVHCGAVPHRAGTRARLGTLGAEHGPIGQLRLPAHPGRLLCLPGKSTSGTPVLHDVQTTDVLQRTRILPKQQTPIHQGCSHNHHIQIAQFNLQLC